MKNYWKAVHVFVPANLSPRQVGDHIDAQVRIIASEAGDFVQRIQVGLGSSHSDDWWQWTASYLPGPPAAFPVGWKSPDMPSAVSPPASDDTLPFG